MSSAPGAIYDPRSRRRHSHSSPKDEIMATAASAPRRSPLHRRSESFEGLNARSSQMNIDTDDDDLPPNESLPNEDERKPRVQASNPYAVQPTSPGKRRVVPPPRNLTNPLLVPTMPQLPKSTIQRDSIRRLIVVLERCSLEAYKVSGRSGKDGSENVKYALLNCDDHQGILAKTGRDIADARPDITHQASSTL
ncbi:hypothetical protein FRB99_002139 [Tulasnella sp. 403]|nr:hypothetical protein FRB99_002139 [Tulasnella sp. 403]